ncbi:hypothetical protein RKD37_006402 [Streptomyces ambofaciens]
MQVAGEQQEQRLRPRQRGPQAGRIGEVGHQVAHAVRHRGRVP